MWVPGDDLDAVWVHSANPGKGHIRGGIEEWREGKICGGTEEKSVEEDVCELKPT